MKYSILLTSILFSTFVNGQKTIEKYYSGFWGETCWGFYFHINGTFEKRSRGHFGNTLVKGVYKIYNDTLELTNGYEKTHGTIKKLYLIDGDSCIIDTYLKYDYRATEPPNTERTNLGCFESKLRNFKYPQKATNDKRLVRILNTVLNLVFNDTAFIREVKIDYFENKQPILLSYFEINPKSSLSFTILGQKPKFISEPSESKVFLEFEDINQNNDIIDLDIKLRGIPKTFSITARRKNNKWFLTHVDFYDF